MQVIYIIANRSTLIWWADEQMLAILLCVLEWILREEAAIQPRQVEIPPPPAPHRSHRIRRPPNRLTCWLLISGHCLMQIKCAVDMLWMKLLKLIIVFFSFLTRQKLNPVFLKVHHITKTLEARCIRAVLIFTEFKVKTEKKMLLSLICWNLLMREKKFSNYSYVSSFMK